jgi:hypothetical protein
VQNGRERRLDVSLLIGVVDPQQELPAMPPREQPIEQRRPHAADVKIPGRAGSKSSANSHDGEGLRLETRGLRTAADPIRAS